MLATWPEQGCLFRIFFENSAHSPVIRSGYPVCMGDLPDLGAQLEHPAFYMPSHHISVGPLHLRVKRELATDALHEQQDPGFTLTTTDKPRTEP